MTQDPSPELSLNADTFTRRLAQAVHDKKHEIAPKVGLRHFWDTSCLAFPLEGYPQLPDTYPNLSVADQLDFLVGSLFSTGQLGTVTLLPGHALEFQQLVRDKVGPRSRSSVDTLNNFLIKHDEQLGQLKAAFTRSREDPSFDHDDLRPIIEDLGKRRPSSFVLMEALAGSPSRRLQRWMTAVPKLLEFAPNPKIDGFQPDQEPFGVLLHHLESDKSSSSRSYVNNISDATVLTALAAMITISRPPYPRFYTNTPALLRLYGSDPSVRQYFSYKVRSENGTLYTDSIWRTSEYYYLRSMFPSLRLSPLTNGVEPDELGSPELAELSLLSNQLSSLLEANYGEFNRTIRSYKFANGEKLEEVIEQFNNIGMASAWVNLPLDDLAGDVAEQFVNPLGDASGADIRRVLVQMWSGFGDFASDVTKLREAVDVADVLAVRLEKVRAVTEAGDEEAEVFLDDDLLAHRWAVPSDPELRNVIYGFANGTGDVGALIQVCAPSGLIHNVRRLNGVLGALYAVEAFDLVISFADGHESSNDETRLIVAAARLRQSQGATSDASRDEAIRRVDDLWDALTFESRIQLCLGFAHCYLRASIGAGGASFVNSRISSSLRTRLYDTVRFVHANLRRLRRDSHERYVFSIDLIAYASILFPDIVEHPESLFLELAQLSATRPRLRRQYRIADTMLYRELRYTIRSLRRVGTNKDDCERLEIISRQLHELVLSTLSATVRTHIAEADQAAKLFGCKRTESQR